MKTCVAFAMVFLASAVVWTDAAGRSESSYARVVFHVR
jgi:hypothetical protein